MNTAGETVTNNVVDSAVAVVKKARGAKPNPNSKYSRSREILSKLSEADRTRKNALAVLGNELGLSDKVASVYFYNIMKELKPTS